MNKTTLWSSAGLAAFVALMATNGKAFFDALLGVPVFLQKLSEVLPLGLFSFALALALSGFVWLFAERWIPVEAKGRDFIAETAALLFAIAAAWLQSHTLQAVLLGSLAGFASPYVFKGVIALWALRPKAAP